MRFAPLLLLAACAAPESVAAGPVLPDLGRPLPALSSASGALSPKEALAAAAAHVEQRETPGSLDHAVALLRPHWLRNPEDFDLNLALAEAHSRACELLDLKKPEERPEHQAQRRAALFHADSALRARPEDGAAKYWRAAVLLHHAEAEQSYKRVQEAHKLLHQAAAAVPSLDSGGPARLLARVYQETPGFPFLGSKPRAVEWYRKSIELAPDYLQTRLWLGETLLQMKQPEPARVELQKAATLPLRPGHEREDGGFRAAAQALLKTLPNPP